MQLDLMIDNENSVIFETKQGNYNSWKKLNILINNGSDIILKAVAYGYRLYTNNLMMHWVNRDLKTLEIYLNLLDKKAIDHNNIVIDNGEIINIYKFITQLMIIYGKCEVIDLEDIDKKYSGLYLSLSKDNTAVITRDRLMCKVVAKL